VSLFVEKDLETTVKGHTHTVACVYTASGSSPAEFIAE
jgi:hypothetical protein